MTEQLAFTLAAAAVGFVAAVFFCIGNVLNSPTAIVAQATPRWDFSEPLARSLAAQRVQYLVGAVLLVAAFLLQVAAAVGSPSVAHSLPQPLHVWPLFVLAVLSATAMLAIPAALLFHRATLRRVLSLAPSVQ